MAAALELKALLQHIRKTAVKLPKLEIERSQSLLCALCMQVAAGQSYSKESAPDFQRLWDNTRVLLPQDIETPSSFPTDEQFSQALALLPAPPAVVAAADPCLAAYAYQFFCYPDRQQSQERLQSANKTVTSADVISFTQLYTPSAIIDRLLNECLDCPDAELPGKTVLDPSCGAGSFLWRAFDLSFARLEAKLGRRRAADICQKMLHGLDIDRTGLWITALGIAARLQALGVEPEEPLALSDVSKLADGQDNLLGALSPAYASDHLLARRFSAVVGNPPYLGRKLLDRRLKEALRATYPHCHQDLCAAFVKRGLDLLAPGGKLGYITQASLLYLPSYSQFRRELIDRYRIVTVIETGAHTFPLQTGEKVNSMLLVLENSRPNGAAATFINEVTGSRYQQPQEMFLQQRGNAFNYRCPTSFIEVRNESSKLEELADIRQGLATSDNNRFLRFWWQVAPEEIGNRWIPYAKGAGSHRWHHPLETVIEWADDGAAVKAAVARAYPYLAGKTSWVIKNERFYFRPGLTFSLVNTRQLSVRELPPGCIFDVAGSAVFSDPQDEPWLLAYLNSSFIAAYADILNPTINFQVGDLKQLPVVALSLSEKEQLAHWAAACIKAKKTLTCLNDSNRQASVESLILPACPAGTSLTQRLHDVLQVLRVTEQQLLELESEIDELVFRAVKARITSADWSSAEKLCQQAVERRAAAASHLQSPTDLCKLIVRRTLYRSRDRFLNQESLWSQLSQDELLTDVSNLSAQEFNGLLTTTALAYSAEQAMSDQRRFLRNTVRREIAADSDGVALANSFAELSRSRS